MPRLTIDGQGVDVPPGSTLLDAARKLGISIPTMCHLKDAKPCTSCMVCVVKDCATGRMIPSCSAPAAGGMVVDSRSDEVRQARKQVLDLLLSEHVGDCEAPCLTTCPARMDIPLMIRQIAAGQIEEAYRTVTGRIALPAVLGRICPAPCEKACRRGKHDKPVSICLLKRFVADMNLPGAAGRQSAPVRPGSRKVAIIGAGPAGLAAAYYLARDGYACTVFDDHDQPGGQLRYRVSRDRLPLDVLEAEIAVIRRLGVEFRMNTRIDPAGGLQRLKSEFDAVVLAPGRIPGSSCGEWPVESDGKGIRARAGSFQTSDPAVFAGGEVVHAGQMSVRAVAHGKSIATAIDQWLSGRPVVGLEKAFESRMGQLREGEIGVMMEGADPGARLEARGGFALGYSREEAMRESRRCLHCDCRKAKDCKLRDLSGEYGASQKTFAIGTRKRFSRTVSSPLPLDGRPRRVVFEPGKCIKCGICVRLSGLAFLGRGYEAAVGVPFGDSLDSALGPAAADCVRECPTGALAWSEP